MAAKRKARLQLGTANTAQARTGRAARTRRRATPAKADLPTTPVTQSLLLSLRTDAGDRFDLPLDAGTQRVMQQAAMRWSYIARYRERWRGAESAVKERTEDIAAELASFGLDAKALSKIAQARVVEVGIPYVGEATGWEARVLPWEYLLTAATRAQRTGPLVVVRHLQRETSPPRRGAGPAKKLGAGQEKPTTGSPLLIVETVPGKLREEFRFTAERRLVARALGLSQIQPLPPRAAANFSHTPSAGRDRPWVLEDPTGPDCAELVAQLSPDVIHLAGVDNHQAAQLLGISDRGGGGPGDRIRDGLPFTNPSSREPVFAAADEAARLLTAGRPAPRLVGCNVYNSGARLAALAVAGGAQAALGFQDTFDDALAELLFATLYEEWRESRGDVLLAFRLAMDALRNQQRNLRGTGVVLWSEASLVEPLTRTKASARSASEVVNKRREDLALEEQKAVQPGTLTADNLDEWLTVKIHPHKELNYSLLHNNRELFSAFEINKHKLGCIRDVDVRVELHAGAEAYPYRKTVDLVGKVTDLNPDIRVPLTSALLRSTHERMYTSLLVEIMVNGLVLTRDTHRVALLPADEWRDDESAYSWLPSFVLPRDPQVARIIALAQRYLVVLADDTAAGFDGYQSINERTDDFTTVDQQVQAIWWAIVQDMQLGYINPPPTYTESSQRLRTPSQIVEGKAGTCIDLTLLLASCLEYVEIYPVVFLFEGHACPGYWRSEKARRDFRDMRKRESRALALGLSAADVQSGAVSAQTPSEQFYVLGNAFGEVRQNIRDGVLVPVEAVSLTGSMSLWQAEEQGRENFARRSEFEAMIDIRYARESGITPLPIREDLQ